MKMGSVIVESGKEVLTMADYFAGGHLRFVNGEWRDDNGDAIEISRVRHGKWVEKEKYTFGIMYDCSLCEDRILDNGHPWNYCPNCGAKMDGGDGNSDIA